MDPRYVGTLEELREEPGELASFARRPLPPVSSQRGLRHPRPVEHPIHDLRGLALAALGRGRFREHPEQLVDLATKLIGGLARQRRIQEAQGEGKQYDVDEQAAAGHHAPSSEAGISLSDSRLADGVARGRRKSTGSTTSDDARPAVAPTLRTKPRLKIP